MRNLKRESVLVTAMALLLSLVSFGLPEGVNDRRPIMTQAHRTAG
jgi:hypothetical protein